MNNAKNGIISLLIVMISLLFLSPIYIMIVNSFKTRAELYENVLSLPGSFSFEYYTAAIKKMNFFVALGNSLYVTTATVIFVIVLASMMAWMLVRRDNVWSKIIFFPVCSNHAHSVPNLNDAAYASDGLDTYLFTFANAEYTWGINIHEYWFPCGYSGIPVSRVH